MVHLPNWILLLGAISRDGDRPLKVHSRWRCHEHLESTSRLWFALSMYQSDAKGGDKKDGAMQKKDELYQKENPRG